MTSVQHGIATFVASYCHNIYKKTRTNTGSTRVPYPFLYLNKNNKGGETMNELKRGFNRDFFTVPNGILFLGLGNSSLKLYLLFLCMLDNSHTCFPSFNFIQDKLQMGRGTISRSVKELEEKELISVERKYNIEKGQEVNIYTVYAPVENNLSKLM